MLDLADDCASVLQLGGDGGHEEVLNELNFEPISSGLSFQPTSTNELSFEPISNGRNFAPVQSRGPDFRRLKEGIKAYRQANLWRALTNERLQMFSFAKVLKKWEFTKYYKASI